MSLLVQVSSGPLTNIIRRYTFHFINVLGTAEININ